MTAVLYVCVTKEGNEVIVNTLAEARKVAAGGEYTVNYEEYHPQSEKKKAVK